MRLNTLVKKNQSVINVALVLLAMVLIVLGLRSRRTR